MLPFGRQHRKEAVRLLTEQMAPYRQRSYADLQRLIGNPDTVQVTGLDGKEYQIEIDAAWDREPDGDLRVCGAIDDGLLTAYVCTKPFLQGFIICPDGTVL